VKDIFSYCTGVFIKDFLSPGALILRVLNEQYCRLGREVIAINFLLSYDTIQLCERNNSIPKTLLCYKIPCEKRRSARKKVVELTVFTIQES
jgi:hypothetical protein